MIVYKNGFIKIDTENTTLLLRVDGRLPEIFYFGQRLLRFDDFSVWRDGELRGNLSSASDYEGKLSVISMAGDGNNRETALHLVSASGNGSLRLALKDVRLQNEKPVLNGLPSSFGEKQSVILVYADERMGVEVEQYYAIYENSDVISTGLRLKNLGTQSVFVKRMLSLQLDFEDGDYEAVALYGAWCRERKKERIALKGGCLSNASFLGYSSNAVNPFAMLVKKGKRGFAVGSNLVYSGNHKEFFDRSVYFGVRMASGMNDFMMNVELPAGGSMDAPEAVFVYAPTEEEVSMQMRAFTSQHIIPLRWQNKARPIKINSWETFLFNFQKKKLIDLCERAVELGIEQFVLDDGWFGKRDDDTTSLGDWYANEEKIGGTLKQLGDEIRSRGLQFGIWVEPEMISEDSDLYRAHPEYALTVDGVQPLYIRTQLVLDITQAEARAYIVDKISRVIEESGTTYVKWDCNRGISELKGNGDYFYRHTLAVYDLFKTLTEKYPDVLFESCASGGNRFDLGMLCYTPQIWTSDNTDARSRITIQDGTLTAYPQSTMSAHVGHSPSYLSFNATSLKDRFAVSACGVLGYEFNLSELDENGMKQVRAQTEFYKKWRDVLQFGEVFQVDGGTDEKHAFYTYVSHDKSKAVGFGFTMVRDLVAPESRLFVGGLEDTALYEVELVNEYEGTATKRFVASGSTLNNGGVYVGKWFTEKNLNENSNSIGSMMATFTRLEK
jgi:alpha-galactosidase